MKKRTLILMKIKSNDVDEIEGLSMQSSDSYLDKIISESELLSSEDSV